MRWALGVVTVAGQTFLVSVTMDTVFIQENLPVAIQSKEAYIELPLFSGKNGKTIGAVQWNTLAQ